MHSIGDVLGDGGRKALDACVKVKIYGRPQNIAKYHWEKAWRRLSRCYAGFNSLPVNAKGPQDQDWLHLQCLVLPTEWDNENVRPKDKICDIIEINDALKNFDKTLYVEKYPKPGLGSDELKELIDKRRADIERECEEASADPDARNIYSWLVAQRRVRDCYAGSFAGDRAFLKYERTRNPNELCNIVDIHDAVVRYDKTSFFNPWLYLDYDDMVDHSNDRWKKFGTVRETIEREFQEASSNPEMDVVEYAQDEAEQRVKDCYDYFPQHAEILPIKMHESGMPQTTQTYNIFDIHKALEQFDEKKLIQKYPEDEGPGSHELKKSIDKNNSAVKKEYWEAKRGLRRYSRSDAEKRVKDCFSENFLEDVKLFPNEEENQSYDIFDIHKMLFHLDKIKRKEIVEQEEVKKNRDAISKEFQKARKRLGKYSQNEAERRARDCFAGTFLEVCQARYCNETVGIFPGDTEIFLNKEKEKSGIPKSQCTYDIFDIRNAIDHFDAKKLCDRYLDEKDPDSKRKNQQADDERKKIAEEYAEATPKVEIEHGSGFIVHDHFIVTNKHVIVDAENDKNKEIFVSNAAIGELLCEVAYTDAVKDLALLYCQQLNIEQNGITPLHLSNQSLLPGMQIFSFGYPISHRGKKAIFVNGYVSGSKETNNQLCSLNHMMVVLNCSLNSGNSGGPILCWEKGDLKVLGVATQKHFKEILTLEEIEKIEKIRESLQTFTIAGVSDVDIKSSALGIRPDKRQTSMNLLTLKLYDALETHSQFNLSNALPGHCVVEFIQETFSKYKEEGKEELAEILKWSEEHANILPASDHPSAFES